MALKYRAGGLLAGQTFTIDDGMLKFQGPYGKRFAVPISQIDTVTTDSAKGMGKAKLKIVGNGTELASIDLPAIWVSKTQEWLLQNLDLNKEGVGSSLDDLAKLADLKEKGVITEKEFEAKKKQLLS